MACVEKDARAGFVIAVGCGCGLSAAAAVRADADIILTYHTAVIRMKGQMPKLSRLPYFDCNELVMGVLPEIISASQGVPVIAGFGAHDPFKSAAYLVERAASLGASGVVNEPFIGAYGPIMRKEFDDAGIGFNKEVELIAEAARREMLGLGWCFSIDDALAFAAAGATHIGALIEFEPGDADGVKKAADYLNRMRGALSQAGHSLPILVHGHAVESARILRRLIDSAHIEGFATGSSGERAPAFEGICAAIRGYKNLEDGDK